jgi:acetyl-CoA carboxylase carboxyltransferase component
MSWEPELEELRQRVAFAQRMGGADKVARQHNSGRLTVRERIEHLLDADSFHEIGAIAGVASYDDKNQLTDFVPANSVFGQGRIDGRPVMVAGDDFTVRGGSADASIWEKMRLAEIMAHDYRLPLIRLIEGSGGGGSVRTIETKGRANLPNGIGTQTGFDLCARNMGVIPVVALGLGSVAGLGAARLCASHYSLMVKEMSAVFVAGPPVVARTDGPIGKQELGGWQVQLNAGAVDDAVESEAEAFDRARRFLSYMPSSVYALPDRGPQTDDPKRSDERLLSAVPRDKRKVYRMRQIIESVVDRGSFFEISRGFGRELITGLARLDGWPVALMAGDPYYYGGAWGPGACQKVVRFVDLAQTFHLPVVHLVDCPGFQVGLAAESSGAIRHGVRAMTAIDQATVPWCSVIIRSVFGVAGGAHQPHARFTTRYAWPSARWGSLPLEGGVEVAYRAELDAAADPKAALAEIEARLEALRSPFRTAEAFWVEEIIDPRDTRRLLCDFANLAAPVRETGKASFTMRP